MTYPVFKEVDTLVTLAMIALMLGALIGGIWHRFKTESSITQRFIQFVGTAWVIGATVLLSNTGGLDNTATAAILGALAGYLFSLRRHE